MSSTSTTNQSNPPLVVCIASSDDDDDSLPSAAFESNGSFKTKVEGGLTTVSPTSCTTSITTKEVVVKVDPSSGASATVTEVDPETIVKAKCTKEKATFAFDGEPGQLLLPNGELVKDDKDPRNLKKGFQKRTIPNLLINIEPGHKHEGEGLLMLHVILKYIETVTPTVFFAHGQLGKQIEAMHKCSFTDATARLKHVTTYRNKVKKAFDTLTAYVNELHSRGKATEAEQYPQHLKEYIVRWENICKAREDLAKTPSQSEKNRLVQNSVTGVARPAGTTKGTKTRVSTRKGNENDLGATNLVERGKKHNDPVPPKKGGEVRKPDGEIETTDSSKKPKRGSVLGMMHSNAEHQQRQNQQMDNVMNALVEGQQAHQNAQQQMENLANRKMAFKENQAKLQAQERAQKLELKKMDYLQKRRDRQISSLQRQYRRHQNIIDSDGATDEQKSDSNQRLSVIEIMMNNVDAEFDRDWAKFRPNDE